MKTVLDSLREIIGVADFYDVVTGAYDYGAMLEYFFCGVLLCIVVSSVFRLLGKLVAR